MNFTTLQTGGFADEDLVKTAGPTSVSAFETAWSRW